MSFKNKIRSRLALLGLVSLCLPSLVLAQSTQVISNPLASTAQNPLDIGLEVSGIDTIAGYSALIKTKATLSNKGITFKVKKPSGSEILIPAQTNAQGIAKVDLYDYHTRRAGIYETSAKFEENETFGPVSTFRIYPDEVSSEQSLIHASKQTALANNLDQIAVSMSLKDSYGNAIQGHTVELISSRSLDKIVRSSRQVYTDARGEISFLVGSEKPGISVYSAYDSTVNQTLNQRVKVVYYGVSQDPLLMGGDEIGYDTPLAYAQSDEDLAPVTTLKIEDLNDIIKINDTASFTVAAYTETSEVATHYTGTVRFSSTDDNSSLPADYTFRSEDLGSHTFSLGLSFITPGVQILSVNDLANADLGGRAEITVTTEDITGLDGTITLLSPIEGTYSQSTIEVSGDAPVGYLVKIYANDQEIGETYVGTDRHFIYQAELASGLHTVYAALLDEDDTILEVSDEVSIHVDLAGALIDYLEITPTQTTPGTLIEAKLLSEPDLYQISVIVGDSIYELTESLEQAGTYTASLAAPSVEGSYPVDVILVDQLGNESSLKAQATLTVVGSETAPYPSKVTGVSTTPGDNRITLSWNPATDDQGIYHYQIYYGLDSAVLDQFVETYDDATTWYVPNLTPGKTYYFQITALDFDNNENPERSTVVSAIPEGEMRPTKVTGVTAVEEVNKITLSWNASTDDTYIDHYEIKFGTASDQINQRAATFDDRTTWYLADLTGDITHYFHIVAYDSDGNPSLEKSDLLSATPLAGPLPDETPGTGPTINLLVGSTIGLSAIYLLFRIRRKEDYFSIQL